MITVTADSCKTALVLSPHLIFSGASVQPLAVRAAIGSRAPRASAPRGPSPGLPRAAPDSAAPRRPAPRLAPRPPPAPQNAAAHPRPGAARQAPPKTGRERVDRAPRGDGADGAGGRLLRADPLRLRRAARRALDGYPRFYPPCPHRFPVCSSSEQQICGHGEQG